ncbi:hypothetical protein G4X40_00345 [Rhodococcus sp. D2-41]|uniref:hypothetical protein n=1 Tax=Speluncibacter jeojiensis TaxID=2710754 RepID=UPI00240FA7EE|nr:hypothetical protein [Rhodococcus sp. D2-41]MDG3008599.1 hypothetical protein [Rhodococcus sp. D2-41]
MSADLPPEVMAALLSPKTGVPQENGELVTPVDPVRPRVSAFDDDEDDEYFRQRRSQGWLQSGW